ncbi:MAG: hypothetical protein HC819_01525 [Cyclobacteriaceae bacterium]|nr:hypothetical protein [Cyclobacteriaceae bacterium]
MMHKYPYCASTDFKNDITELCEKCPLIDKAKVLIDKQIEPQVKQQQEILTKEQFQDYLNNEIESAQNAMKRVKLLDLQNNNGDNFRCNRIEVYILNKERIKKLNEFNSPPIQKVHRIDFTNNFDEISVEQVYDHFKEGLLETNYLTSDELNIFLKSAFELKEPPTPLLTIKNSPPKNKIMKVFYEYYRDLAAKPHGRQKEYAGLLGNNFQGYDTDNISSNFSKTVY